MQKCLLLLLLSCIGLLCQLSKQLAVPFVIHEQHAATSTLITLMIISV